MDAATQSPLTELVAVADLIEERGKAAAERFGVGKVYREGTELIDDPEIEAVVLAFPACGRKELALYAFECGKHVLTEKPVAMDAGEVKEMIAARGDLVAACCSSRFRFPEGARVAADFIATGALGDLRVVRCRELRPAGEPPASAPPTWRLRKAENGGGILLNWGCYDIDYVLGITGWSLKPETIFAQTWTVPPQFESHVAPDSDAETYYVGIVRCEGGAVLTLERGEFMAAGEDAAWQIIGTKGSLKLTMTGTSPSAIIHDDSTEAGVVSRTLWEGQEEWSLIHEGPLADLATAIREGRAPMTGLEQALVVQQISDGIYASAETGECVRVA
jgi:predicted dehydrogenase